MATPWAEGAKGLSAKKYTNHFSGWGMNRFFAVSSAVAAAATGASAATNFVQDSWNEDPHTFENAGYALGAMGTELAFAGTAAVMGYDMWRTSSGTGHALDPRGTSHETVRYKGKYYDPGTTRTRPNGRKSPLSGAKGAQKGFRLQGLGKSDRFIKAGTWKRDLLWLGAAPILASIGATAAMGAAGSFIDGAIQETKQRNELNYDNRFFDTSRQDANTFSQVGMAMRNYENRMMSVARIYHSR